MAFTTVVSAGSERFSQPAFDQPAAPASVPPQEFPRLTVSNLHYVGAFRLPAKEFGASSLNFAQGPICFNPSKKSLFIVGHAHHQALAEFAIPELTRSDEPSKLKIAAEPIQPFSRVLDRPAGGNPEKNNRIGGLLCLSGPDGPELLINAYEYYDAPGDNTASLLALRNANDLAESRIDGYFKLAGGPGHTAGWMSPIPAPWQAALGGRFLTGHSSGIPIISRTSVGPSAFVFNPSDIAGKASVSAPLSTIALLDFSLDQPLAADLSNRSRKNDLWNHLSRAVYGIIIPKTRTYATFGHSGGNESGIGYKNLRDDGSRSGGYSTYAVKDNYLYYWFWDVNDLVRVKQGKVKPYHIRPYEYGILKTPFNSLSHKLGGGTFDSTTGFIYLTVQGADHTQGRYSNPPIVMAYKAVVPTRR